MSEPTDPREIRHNAGQHDCGLNPVSPSKDGVHVHTIDPSQLPQHDYGAHRFPGLTAQQVGSDARIMQPSPLTREDIAQQLRNMNPQTIRERHMRTMLPRTPYDRDIDRKSRADFAVKLQRATSSDQETLRQRCVSIINSLEHMESDKDIALIALEKLCGVGK